MSGEKPTSREVSRQQARAITAKLNTVLRYLSPRLNIFTELEMLTLRRPTPASAKVNGEKIK